LMVVMTMAVFGAVFGASVCMAQLRLARTPLQ
jgi:hypothetical protein